MDSYKYGLYEALASQKAGQTSSHEGNALFGFEYGNHYHSGCLTDDPTVRLHSCEPGTGCPALKSPGTVFITPIIQRTGKGEILPELGAGGGVGDLAQTHTYLEFSLQSSAEKLIELCTNQLEDPHLRARTVHVVKKAFESNAKALSLDDLEGHLYESELKLKELPKLLSKISNLEQSVTRSSNSQPKGSSTSSLSDADENLARRIVRRLSLRGCRLIYFRHSHTPGILHTKNCAIW